VSDDEKKKKKKDKEETVEPRNPATITPDNPDLARWIQELWAENESPQKICVVQLMQRGRVFGTIVKTVAFHGNRRLGADEAGELSNSLLAVAQEDCDVVVRKPQAYGVIAYDASKGSEPYSRKALLLRPKAYLVEQSRAHEEDDDEDNPQDAKTIALRYLQEQVKALQFEKTHYATGIGDAMTVLRDSNEELRGWVSDLITQNRAIFSEAMGALRQLEEARSAELDRKIALEWAQLKISLAKDGMRTARNLLPGILSGDKGGNEGGTNSPSNGNGNGSGTKTKSMEQVLVDNFLNDCGDTGVQVALFGDCEVKNGELKLVDESKPGIFTLRQFAILLQVREGNLPAEALDALMPGSGKPDSITPEQIAKAQPLLTEGTGMALMELVGLRRRRNEEKSNANATQGKG